MKFGPVSKAIAGSVAGMISGNVGIITMSADQSASMPWWGVLISNVVYAAIGFATVYFAPRNTPAA